jgi:UDP-2,3-diacylglucosamine pyrophosphatase LpxH
MPVESAYQSNDAEAEEAQVVMHGTHHESYYRSVTKNRAFKINLSRDRRLCSEDLFARNEGRP